ncbi:hypothetical protein Dthio_PD2533 [Desulfonatronospira thiodismutans ASO3-1]|uniref:Uncharacterized protein n=1 Tax=Desulfonatronospira thiodismutans ASO3-1 TaxID=555779 RepID=D6SQW2_9BACT|nr:MULTISPECIES: hypothetical protein [Desulfonatronospira]EFI35138.1 hypothetical protein Dthio_PD2533 [Desulfonatronospira thiodismutans ASO3-1]RQD75625.1 MAG: hypothetical protein D5S03_08005 [Desulfonatronospira sp. MSAO_Bac3]
MSFREQMDRLVRSFELNPWQLFLVGWRLILSEIRWNFTRMFRQWEIRQMKKRLDQEKLKLAEAVVSGTSGRQEALNLKDSDLDLVLGQVSFLEEEISHLENELQARRRAFLENRMSRYLGRQD